MARLCGSADGRGRRLDGTRMETPDHRVSTLTDRQLIVDVDRYGTRSMPREGGRIGSHAGLSRTGRRLLNVGPGRLQKFWDWEDL